MMKIELNGPLGLFKFLHQCSSQLTGLRLCPNGLSFHICFQSRKRSSTLWKLIQALQPSSYTANPQPALWKSQNHGVGWAGRDLKAYPILPPAIGRDTFHYPRSAALGLTFPWQSAASPSLSSSSAMLCYIWAKKGKNTDDNLLFLKLLL